MNYKSAAILYIISLVIMMTCDFVWLKFIAHDWYMKLFGQWIQSFILLPALFFYLLFVLGLHVFVIHMVPVETSSLVYGLYGAFFGCIAYATYDLTNLATIKDWPVYGACVDIAWGAFVAGLTTYSTILISRFWNLL